MNFIPLNGWPQLKEIPEQLEHFREVYARFAKVNRWYRSIEETELTGNPVIFEKALKLNATALSVEMLPIQSGSGDPSPTNVRPISGRTAVVITQKDSEDQTTKTLTIALGTTVYGGTLDVKTGVLTITDVYKKFTTNDTWTQGATAGERKRFLHVLSPEIATPAVVPSIDGLYCSILKPQTADSDYICRYLTNSRFDVILPNSANVSTVDEMKQWAATNELEIAYPLATPTTVQLTGEELEMLKGYNYISTDANSLTVKAYTI